MRRRGLPMNRHPADTQLVTQPGEKNSQRSDSSGTDTSGVLPVPPAPEPRCHPDTLQSSAFTPAPAISTVYLYSIVIEKVAVEEREH